MTDEQAKEKAINYYSRNHGRCGPVIRMYDDIQPELITVKMLNPNNITVTRDRVREFEGSKLPGPPR